MIARLRALAERPIADEHRRRAFALAAAVVLLAAALLAATRAGDPPRGHTTGHTAVASTTSTASATSPPATSDANATARRFLAGYLGYLYGRAPARVIEEASPALATRLAAERPRISPAMRERRPRVIDVTATPAAGGGYTAIAVIDDGGVERYPIDLTVEPRDGRLEVTEVGSP